jgi:hypothetical protein
LYSPLLLLVNKDSSIQGLFESPPAGDLEGEISLQFFHHQFTADK